MNKAQLIDAVAAAAKVNKAEAGRCVESMLDIVTNTLKSGESVTLVGFGTYSIRHRAGAERTQSADR